MTAPDFWEALDSRMPGQLDYVSLCDRFTWDLPSDYNIGVDVFDRYAADKGKLAIIHDRGDGTAEKWTSWELKRASDRFANALRALGVERGDRVAVLLSQSPQLPVAHIVYGQTECNLVLAGRLGAREIEFVNELPITPTGKVRRNVLRQREEAKA